MSHTNEFFLGACKRCFEKVHRVFQAMNGVAVIRPPGHHCRAENPMGFCLLGNVPIACRYALDKYGVERLVIVFGSYVI